MFVLSYLSPQRLSRLIYSSMRWGAGIFIVFLITSCGIQIKDASLYDGVEVEPIPPKPEKIELAVEPEIFAEDATNFWTPEDDGDCTVGEVTSEVVHSGERALAISWNRDPKACKWAGFGLGWDDWAGKDLTDVYDHAAIQMYIRSKEGTMFGLPIVLTLEDYSGNMAWSYTGNKYFERYFIDEEWQAVTVPLNTFDLEEDGLDLGNIKQLMFELQQAGSIYIDDIELVFYEPQPVTPWLPDAPKPDALSFPIQLFDDAFINNNGWGIMEDHCQKIELTSSTRSEGNQSIHAVWDDSKEDCYMVALGISWNQWFPSDLSAAAPTTVIELDIRSTDARSLAEIPVKVGFEDYERRTSFVKLDDRYLDGGAFTPGTWQTVRIPMADLSGEVDLSDLKQLLIRMEGAGEVYLDNIRLIRLDS